MSIFICHKFVIPKLKEPVLGQKKMTVLKCNRQYTYFSKLQVLDIYNNVRILNVCSKFE